jgi:hypothetical protein
LKVWGGGDEFAPNVSTILFRKLSNVKSVHQQCDNVLQQSNQTHFQVMELQLLLWKPHDVASICCNFFSINDKLHVELMNFQMLQCIIYRPQ